MNPKDVADYLRENPHFFDDHADVIADLAIPHPHGGHAIPLAERQVLALREKNAELEMKLRELIAYGNDNDAIGEKLHRSTLALFAAPDLETTLAVLTHALTEDFGVPSVAVRLWGRVPEQSYLPELAAVSAETRGYADALGSPYCGPEAAFETNEWFDNADELASFAYLPLRTSHTFGLLSLASPDANRFHPGMGTLYLMRLAELASVAVARFLPRTDAMGAGAARNAALAGRFAASIGTRAAHTRSAYQRDVGALLALAGEAPVERETRASLSRHLATLRARGLSGRSLARMLSAWRAFYRFLMREDGSIAQDPCADLKAPKSPRTLPAALSPDEATRLVAIDDASFLGLRDRALFELAYSSGLRLAELAGLDLARLDLAAGEVRVIGKGSKERIVPVGAAAREALARWLDARAGLRTVDAKAVFVGAGGRRLSPRSIEARLAQQAVKQGLDRHVHPHMLRHSFASHVLQSSGDLRAVQEMLGHASIASTQVYTHLDFQALAKVYDAAHPREKRAAKG